MLDRSIAPASNHIEEFHLLQAQSQKLANGSFLHVVNVSNQPVVKIEVILKAGQWYEPIKGVSYFTAKMLAEGTKKRSAQYISNYFDQFGAFLEVSPGLDFINVTLYCLAKHIPDLLPLLAELINESAFPEPEFETLVGIKRQKLKVDLEKNSYLASRKFRELLFGAKHPYGSHLEEADLDLVHRNDMVDFYQSYIPGPFEVIVSGQVDDKVVKALEQYLGQTPKTDLIKEPDHHFEYEPFNFTFEKKESLQSSIRVGMPMVKRNHPDYIPMLVLNEILGGYFGSRLMRNIREEKGYTYGISSQLATLTKEGFWVISTDVKKDFRDSSLEEIFKEVKFLTQELVSIDELETVRNYMLGSFLSGINTPFDLADRFKLIHFHGLGYDYYHEYFKVVKHIEPEELMTLAQKYWHREELSTIVVG